MFKKLIKGLAIVGVVIGLSLGTIGCDEEMYTEFAVETAAMVLAKEAAEKGMCVDQKMIDYYNLVKSGQYILTAADILKIKNYLMDDLGYDALLADRIVRLVEMAGAEINLELGELDLSNLDMGIIEAAVNGFVLGLQIYGDCE